ncbi:hypothetical protein SHIRM173S_02650 [Streptomyces hirsutus]
MRIPPSEPEVGALFTGWGGELATCRKFAPTARNYTAAKLMSQVGLRVSEACKLDLADIEWDLGRFGKLHVHHGEGTRGLGPREQMVPLINGADRTLRWFIEDLWGQFDNDRTRPGAPLPLRAQEHRRLRRRVGDDALRGGLDNAVEAHLPGWATSSRRTSCGTSARPNSTETGWTCSQSRRYWGIPGSPRPCGISTCSRPGSRTPGPPGWNGPRSGWKARPDEVEPAADRREQGRLEGLKLQQNLAEHGLVISAGKMSGLWSGQPVSLKLEDLDVICVVLDCEIGDLLIPGEGPPPGRQRRRNGPLSAREPPPRR